MESFPSSSAHSSMTEHLNKIVDQINDSFENSRSEIKFNLYEKAKPKKVCVGFLTNNKEIIGEYQELNNISEKYHFLIAHEFFDCGIYIKPEGKDNSKNSKFRIDVELNDTKFIEIAFSSIESISFNTAKKIIELKLYLPFTCLNKHCSYIQNSFVNLRKDQLLRYWLMRPYIRFEFSNALDNLELEKLIKLFSMQQSKQFRNILFDKTIINISNVEGKLGNFQQKFMNKLMLITSTEIIYLIFCILSQYVLKYPVDFDLNFLDFIALNIESEKEILFMYKALGKFISSNAEKNGLKMTEFHKTFLDKFYMPTSIFNFNNLNHHKNNFSVHMSDSHYKIPLYDNKMDMVKVKRINVTPNLIIYDVPVWHNSNRILKNNKENLDKFLIINFCDDKYKRMSYCMHENQSLVSHIGNILIKGVEMADRTYNFLSYSNSQIKTHSTWMILESESFNIYSVFRKLGDFDKIKSIPKNAARRGLCLTSAKFLMKLDRPPITIEDYVVKNVDDSMYSSLSQPGVLVSDYNFTDGIGTIPNSIALIAAKKFNKEYASAFQIRIAGYKGVLTVDPYLKDTSTIYVRNSMKKFESDDRDLYIVRTSGYTPGFLNRQIIMLLSELGIADQIFIQMQSDMIAQLNKVKSNEAIIDFDIFRTTSFLKNMLSQIQNKLKDIKSFKKAKILKGNAFFKEICHTLYLTSLEGLKSKTNIYDKHSGRFIGVIDEHNILKEGEVFLKICKNRNVLDSCQIIKGDIMITKNPCTYVGDIQVLKGADHPDLQHLINVIVFPKTGVRPVQQLISGGDLDGDVYFTSWNKNLIPQLNSTKIFSLEYIEKIFESKGVINSLHSDESLSNNERSKNNLLVDISSANASSDYDLEDELPNEEAIILNNQSYYSQNGDDKYDRSHIIRFFCDYLKNDILGIICNRHLAISDKNQDGSLSAEALILSIYQRRSLNFAKTGQIVSYDEMNIFKVKKWPDFMEKKNGKSYQSKKVLGKLYREIKNIYDDIKGEQIIKSSHSNNLNMKMSDQLFPYLGFELFLNIAKDLYILYCECLVKAMRKSGVKTECEFLSGVQFEFKKNKNNEEKFEIFRDINIFIFSQRKYYKLVLYAIFNCFSKYYPHDLVWEFLVTRININDIHKIKVDVEDYFYENYFKSDSVIEKIFLEIEKVININDAFYKQLRRAFLSACYLVSNYYKSEDLLFHIVNENAFNFSDFGRSDENLQKYFSFSWILDYEGILCLFSDH